MREAVIVEDNPPVMSSTYFLRCESSPYRRRPRTLYALAALEHSCGDSTVIFDVSDDVRLTHFDGPCSSITPSAERGAETPSPFPLISAIHTPLPSGREIKAVPIQYCRRFAAFTVSLSIMSWLPQPIYHDTQLHICGRRWKLTRRETCVQVGVRQAVPR